jgi:hypothetical protein
MRFYQQSHRFYCGVDLHARCMYLCVLDHQGQTVLHQNYPADAGALSNPFPITGRFALERKTGSSSRPKGLYR